MRPGLECTANCGGAFSHVVLAWPLLENLDFMAFFYCQGGDAYGFLSDAFRNHTEMGSVLSGIEGCNRHLRWWFCNGDLQRRANCTTVNKVLIRLNNLSVRIERRTLIQFVCGNENTATVYGNNREPGETGILEEAVHLHDQASYLRTGLGVNCPSSSPRRSAGEPGFSNKPSDTITTDNYRV